MDELVEAVVRALVGNDLHLAPLALFGHSFGSLAAYEVCAAMVDSGLPAPLCLFTSAHEPPARGVPRAQARLSTLSDAELWRSLNMWGFAPPAAEDEKEIAALAPLLAPIRADLAIREAYLESSTSHAPLPLPIVPTGGLEDHSISPEALAGWRALGSQDAAAPAELFPGGHFYLHAKHGGPSTAPLLASLAKHAFCALAKVPPSVALGPDLAAAFQRLGPHAADGVLYVHEMFLRSAERAPDAVALVHAGGELSYAELKQQVLELGAWLVGHGAKPRAVVGVLLEHRYESLLAQLATGVAGAAFFPLETHLGPKALAGLLDSASPVALLTSAKYAGRLDATIPTLSFDEPGWRALVRAAAKTAPPAALWARPMPYDAGIVTMTSGTTGAPKTVLNPMVSYAVAVVARATEFPYQGAEREATNVMFSWEAARALCYGAAAVVIADECTVQPAELLKLLETTGATRILTTPSLLSSFLELALPENSSTDARLPLLHTWTLCGEVASAALVRRFGKALPQVRLVNDYSSWEACDTAYATLLDGKTAAAPRPRFEASSRIAPAGEPPAGVAFLLLDPDTQLPVPRGCLGELFVVSPQAFTGYADAPELTAARLLPVPPAVLPLLQLEAGSATHRLLLEHAAEARHQAEADGGTLLGDEQTVYMYRTGDLARLLPNVAAGGSAFSLSEGEAPLWATCQVLGRVDSTVKIRGFKVGLSWVEASIGSLDGVGRCAVATVNDPVTNQPTALVAHVIPAGAAAVAAAAKDEKAWLASLRNAARAELPPHALPRHWMLTPELGAISESESKKLDRKKLPKPPVPGAVPAPASGAPAAPLAAAPAMVADGSAAALEAAMLPIWAEVLETSVASISTTDSFFDLGGHSLLGAKLVAALVARLGLKCTVLDLFEAPTVADLARALCAANATQAPRHAPSMQPDASASRELALIGMEGRFPGANSTDDFWALLASGRDALTLWTKPELHAKGVPEHVHSHPRFVPAAYLVQHAEVFDAAFWSLSPYEAALMDPQHRIFLEVAWAAFENAGYAPRSGTPRRTAVVAAAGIDGYMHHHLDGLPLKDPLAPGDIFLGEVGSEKDYIATRVSYALDLMGPSFSVNSACSSGLLAIAQAAATLLTGQADLALGGASALSFPSHGYLFEDGLVSSIDGRVRPFDAKAHGTVFGDAVGAVVLKRLSDALRDGDNVLATALGYGIANDGARKAGYAAPGVAGQRAAIGAAFAHAGVSAASLSYVECHATGTLVGDGIEARALTDAFADFGAGADEVALRGAFCAIGSVKGNIGHANAAAGVTGLVKAMLCLSKATLVPTAHFESLNKNVILDGTPLHVFRGSAAPWPMPASAGQLQPHRCGVSSFGIGGTNVHMILQAAPPRPEQPAAQPATTTATAPMERAAFPTLCISAKTRTAAGRAAAQLAAYLRSQSELSAPSLESVAASLLAGREAFQHRIAVAAPSRADAIEALEAAAEAAAADGLPPRRSPSSSSVSTTGSEAGADAPPPPKPRPKGAPPPVVLIFPGQGSQCPRMGEGLYRSEPAYRRHLDRLCAKLEPLLGFDLRAKLFPPPGVENEPAFRAAFDAPTVAQPAIFATELALGLTLMQDYGVVPAALAGHSIGEFVAATLAGVWSEDDALRVIALRAKLSEEAQFGAMLAALVSAKRAAELVATPAFQGKLFVAVENTAARQVIAGEEGALLAAAAALTAEGAKSRRLPMNRAYHTPLMGSVEQGLVAALASIALSAPSLPLACNGTGGWMDAATATDAAYWAGHVASRVRWTDNMDLLAALALGGGALVLEVGSGESLAPLLAECDAPGAAELMPLATLRHPRVPFAEGGPDAETFAAALCALWQARVPVAGLLQRTGVSSPFARVALPAYSFEPAVHWLNPERSMYVRPSADAVAAAQAELDAALPMEAAAAAPEPGAPTLVRLRPAGPERRWATAYCLGYAGGSSQAFAELARAAPEWMEVVAVETPGKGALADARWPADEGASVIEAEGRMMAQLAAAIGADAAGSALVLVGWSMGGMLATELALHLQAAGTPPQLVQVAGRMAPGSFVAVEEADLEGYNLAPEAVRKTAAYTEWLLPMLMADLRADARAEQRVVAALATRPQLECELQLCCGDVDPAFPPSAAAAWLPLFGGKASVHTLSGGHEILQRSTRELLGLLVARLLPLSPLYAVEWAAAEAPADPSAEEEEERAALSAGARLLRLAAKPFKVGARELRAAASAGGLVVYLEPLEALASQQEQCSSLLGLVGDVAMGGGGRLVLVCAADVRSSFAAGASKAAPLEYPELAIQRLFLDPAADLLRPNAEGALSSLAALPHVRDGWVAWLAATAARARHECDLRLGAADTPPLAPRLRSLPPPPPAAARAADPSATYLLTGGAGGMGSALVDWLLDEQHVPPANLVLLSRSGAPHPRGVVSLAADLGDAAALAAPASPLAALFTALKKAGRPLGGLFHLAGVLDDGLIANLTPARVATVVAPKAGLLALLQACTAAGVAPPWAMLASSTSSLLGYAGQANYCAANALLDQAAAFGLPSAEGTRILTLNFGPWGEVGMAREGTKAHALSLASGETPMASAAAVSCVAAALRAVQQPGANLQFCVAEVDWWRSPWPDHPLLQGLLRRTPQPPPAAAAAAPPAALAASAAKAKASSAPLGAAPKTEASGDARARAEAWMRGRLSEWDSGAMLASLGLDSLDLVQLRNGFNKHFRTEVPLSIFSNASQTLDELLDKVGKIL